MVGAHVQQVEADPGYDHRQVVICRRGDRLSSLNMEAVQ